MNTTPTALLSVIFIVLIAQVRPHILVTGRMQDIFIVRPQVTKGIVIRVLTAPPVIIAAPGGMPVRDIDAAVSRRNFFASCHLSSHPGTNLLKLKIQSCFEK
jgi:hypothetical protein